MHYVESWSNCGDDVDVTPFSARGLQVDPLIRSGSGGYEVLGAIGADHRQFQSACVAHIQQNFSSPLITATLCQGPRRTCSKDPYAQRSGVSVHVHESIGLAEAGSDTSLLVNYTNGGGA